MRVISTGGNRRRSATEGLAKGVDTPTRWSRFRDASQKKCAELYGPTRSAEHHARLAIIEGALFAKNGGTPCCYVEQRVPSPLSCLPGLRRLPLTRRPETLRRHPRKAKA